MEARSVGAVLTWIDWRTFPAGLGGLTGSAFGVARNVPAIPAAFQTAIKSGVFGFTFFPMDNYFTS